MWAQPLCSGSKKQTTVETSVYGAEFVAMKKGIYALRGLRYKVRMVGIPVSGPLYIYGGNMSAVINTTRPELLIRKKRNSICYHTVYELVAMGKSLVWHIPSKKMLHI